MKKLLVLVLLVMLSLKGFSQNDTKTNQIDTTKVILPIKTARLVYQDLLRYDGLKEEISLIKFKLIKIEERELKKDTIINLLTKKNENSQFIIGKKDEEIQISKELQDKLHKDLKNQKFKTFLWKLGTFSGLVLTTFLLIGK